MNLDKYENTGWGLSRKAFEALIKAIDSLDNIKAIEFGSGFSTEFLLDYASEKNKPIQLDSFDNDAKYMHSKATLVDLLECSDKAYDSMFSTGEIDWSLFKKRFWRPKSRQKNCFYRINESKLLPEYNLALIDGPHGNGRNFAFLLLKDRMKSGYILIDDFNHYDFLEVAKKIFKVEEVARNEAPKDNFVLVKII